MTGGVVKTLGLREWFRGESGKGCPATLAAIRRGIPSQSGVAGGSGERLPKHRGLYPHAIHLLRSMSVTAIKPGQGFAGELELSSTFNLEFTLR